VKAEDLSHFGMITLKAFACHGQEGCHCCRGYAVIAVVNRSRGIHN
jgi:hypothetical protein